MLRRLTIGISTLAVALGVGIASAGAQAPPGSGPGRSADARAEHQRIVDFWTPERRAQAVPLEITRPSPAKGNPNGGSGGGSKKGGKGGGDGSTGTSGVVTGATWTQAGSVDLSTGRIFFQEGSWLYSCSGSAVQSQSGSLVLTAGHCVNDGGGGAFHTTNWIFYPAYDQGSPLGGWTATDLYTTTTWATTTNGFADDMGIATVVGDVAGQTLAQALSAAGASVPTVAFAPSPASGDVYASFGYPAEKKYKGNTLVYCEGPVTVGLDGDSSLAMACDMNGGSSGGPWFLGSSAGGLHTIDSLNSYGYASLNGYMFGPIFDSGEQSAYTGADTATGDCASSPSNPYRCVDITD